MLDQMLQAFAIQPYYDLAAMTPGQDLSALTARVLDGVRRALVDFGPDVLIVQGDTTTAMAASLAGFYHQVPVAHVEAGLRTGDLSAPWPEEGNRRIVTAIASWHFAPTPAAYDNLLREGISAERIEITGNTVIDALLQTNARIGSEEGLATRFGAEFSFLDPAKRLILVTGHRRENLGDGLENVCLALADLVAAHHDVEVLFPVHLNPHVKEAVMRLLGGKPRIHLVPPQDYLRFVYLLGRCFLVLTDSGGIQEEAPSLGKPVLVSRDVTERPEAVEAGTARVVGANRNRIVAEVERLLGDPAAYRQMMATRNPYGDGQAARRIVHRLVLDGRASSR